MHGFASALFGLRTRSRGNGGSLGVGAARVRAAGDDLPATILLIWKTMGKAVMFPE